METNYIIAWKNSRNGRMGRGKKIMEQVQAQQLAVDLNKEHPEYEHIAVEAAANNVHALFSDPGQRAPTLELHSYPGATQFTCPETEETSIKSQQPD